MNLLDMGFGLVEMGVCVAAAIFLFRALTDNDRIRIKPNSSPSFITSQALMGVAFVARLANLLLRQPRPAFEMIEIILLFAAASGTLIILAIRYWRSYNCLQNR
jgi:hypothetical protein